MYNAILALPHASYNYLSMQAQHWYYTYSCMHKLIVGSVLFCIIRAYLVEISTVDIICLIIKEFRVKVIVLLLLGLLGESLVCSWYELTKWLPGLASSWGIHAVKLIMVSSLSLFSSYLIDVGAYSCLGGARCPCAHAWYEHKNHRISALLPIINEKGL